MPNFLGIDMGGTATRWALVDARGEPVLHGKAPPATGHLFSPEARAEFCKAIAEIARQLTGTVEGVFAGITGLGPKQSAEAHGIIAGALGCPPARVRSADDVELAYRAIFAPGEGHLVSAGTGSVGMHVAPAGEQIRVGGRGILVDDAGAGAWIALGAIRAVFRRIDETGTPGDAALLAEALFSAIGGRAWDDVRAFVYGGDRGRIGSLAPAVAKAAQAGDAVACSLLEQAAQELARTARVLVARCGPAPVAFIGGVLALDPSIREGIATALPDTELRFPTVDAALAAARIALEQNGLEP